MQTLGMLAPARFLILLSLLEFDQMLPIEMIIRETSARSE
jgi:hypothetical protein